MLSLLQVYILGIAFSRYVECETIFITPKELDGLSNLENPVYSTNEIVKIEWETDRKGACNLFVWQVWPRGPLESYEKILENTTDTSYIWNTNSSIVTTKPWLKDESDIPVFHFSLYSSDLNLPLANSGNFNISDPRSAGESAPESTSATSMSIPSTSSTETDSPIDSHPAESSQIPAGNPEESGLSTPALVGIFVGVTAVGLSISGIIGFFLWRRFRRGNRGSQTLGSSPEGADFSKAELGGTQVLQIGRSELDSEREAQELWDTQKMAELGDENKIRVITGLYEAP